MPQEAMSIILLGLKDLQVHSHVYTYTMVKWGPFSRGIGTMLLMVQKSGEKATCYLWKPMKKWDILHINWYILHINWVLAGFLPSTVPPTLAIIFDPRDVVPLADTTAKCLGAVVVARYTRSNPKVNYPGLGNPTWLLRKCFIVSYCYNWSVEGKSTKRKCRRPKRTGSSSNPSYLRLCSCFGGCRCDIWGL